MPVRRTKRRQVDKVIGTAAQASGSNIGRVEVRAIVAWTAGGVAVPSDRNAIQNPLTHVSNEVEVAKVPHPGGKGTDNVLVAAHVTIVVGGQLRDCGVVSAQG